MKTIYKLMSIFMILILASSMIAIAADNIKGGKESAIYKQKTPKTIVINSLDDYLYYANKAHEGQEIIDWRSFGYFGYFYHYKIESKGNKISIKPLSTEYGVVGDGSSMVNVLNVFGSHPNGGTSHIRFADGFNIYLHPDSKQNKYVKIDYFDSVGNVKYIINAYGAAYGPRVKDKKSYGKQIKVLYCTTSVMNLFYIMPGWIFNKYDKTLHFSDCNGDIDMNKLINLKEKK